METPPESTPSDTPLPPIEPDQRKPRAVLSCITCRTRKLRCDKGRPCRNCSKRNQVCRYYTFTSAGRNIPPVPNQNSTRSAHDLNRRLQHLEDLLVVLNDQQDSERLRNPSISTTERAPIQAPSEPEDCVDPDHSSDGSHTARPATSRRTSSSKGLDEHVIAPGQWQAALDDIAELRLFLLREPPRPETTRQLLDDPPLQDPVLLLNTLAPTTKADLLASLPPRSTVDQMISKIFSYEEPALIVIHTPTFMREYEQFWTAPHSASLAWLGKLFSLLCLSTIFQSRQGDTLSDQTGTINSFRVRAAQSLIMANYTRPGPHIFEALVVYVASEYFKSKDAQLGVSMLISIVVRLAMSMGYHRDPGRDPRISVFDCEMIRRRWAFIAPVERLTSFQMGLPPILPRALADTLPPLNILDADINPSSTVPPTERPDWERTPMSYILAKGRITRVFAMIMESLYVSKPVPYKAIVQIDMQLQNARSQLPPFFKILPVLQTYFEPEDLIMKRYYLELLYLKGRCLLHRQFLTHECTDSQYAKSRTACLEAARRILRHQADIHREIQPSGILHSSPWFLLSLTTSDFLLAAMIIGLSISQRMQLLNADHDVAALGFPANEDEQVALLQELATSQRIWLSMSQKSAEAGRATEAIRLIVGQAYSASRRRVDDAPLTYLFATDLVTPLPAGSVEYEDTGMSSIVDMSSVVNWESWDRYFGAVPTTATTFPALPALPQDNLALNELPDLTFDPGFMTAPFTVSG